MRKSIYYQSSIGRGHMVSKGVIEDISVCPDESEEFTIMLFSDLFNPIKPVVSKSPVFPVRDLIGAIRCEYLGLNRGVKSQQLSEACYYVESTIKDANKRDIVVISSRFDFTCNEGDIGMAVSSMYKIIKKEVQDNYNKNSNLVICWYLSPGEFDFVLNTKMDGCKCELKESGRVLLLYSE